MGRSLTEGEVNLAKSMFGDLIRYTEIEINDHSYLLTFGLANAPHVPNNGNIYYPSGDPRYSNDFSLEPNTTLGWSKKSIFIHELAHVLQAQNGVDIIGERKDQGPAYNYDQIFNGTPFNLLPIESQAEFIRDTFLKLNGQPIYGDKENGSLEDPLRPVEEYLEFLPSNLPHSTGNVPLEFSPGGFSIPISVPNAMNEATFPATSVGGASGVGQSIGGGVDPLVFDLNGNGVIELVSVTNSNAMFDIWGDGFAKDIGWVGANDGMLAWDIDNSGKIDNVAELFGSSYPIGYLMDDASGLTEFEQEIGFARLKLQDSNADGKIDAADTIWSSLKIWQDVNQDGVSQASELLSMSAAGVQSVDVSNYVRDSFVGVINGGFTHTIAGNTVSHTGTYTTTGGQTRSVYDVWFDTEIQNTRYVGEYALDVRTLFLPTLRGYGQIADLHGIN